MMGLSNPLHIAFLLVILLLVFGAKRLPEMGKSLGSGMRDFKDALSRDDAEHAGPSGQSALHVAPAEAVAVTHESREIAA